MRLPAVLYSVHLGVDGRQVADQVLGLDRRERVFWEMRDVGRHERVPPSSRRNLAARRFAQGVDRLTGRVPWSFGNRRTPA